MCMLCASPILPPCVGMGVGVGVCVFVCFPLYVCVCAVVDIRNPRMDDVALTGYTSLTKFLTQMMLAIEQRITDT